MKNVGALCIVLCGLSVIGENCFGAQAERIVACERYIEQSQHVALDKQKRASAVTLQTFLAEKDGIWVTCGRLWSYAFKLPVQLNNFNEHSNALSASSLEYWSNGIDGPFHRHRAKSNPAHILVVTEDERKEKMCYCISEIENCALTEKLIDMPACSIELKSDSVQINFSEEGQNPLMILESGFVAAIRNQCAEGKVFVIAKCDDDGQVSYRVNRYVHSAHLQWNGWVPYFRWRRIGESIGLIGICAKEKAIVEQGIEIDLSKNNEYKPIYSRNKNIAKVGVLFSLASACCFMAYMFQDKISTLWK